MIKFDQVTKRYPGSNEALRNVSFNIEAGELVFVTGHSGAGKSTLLKLIAAIERPTSGTVLIANQNISKLKSSAIPFMRRRFGLIFQDHKLLYDRNCFENVILPLHINGITGLEAAKRVRAALDKVGLLHKEKAMPITLSGGEQQRLAIARAVVSRPSILIADEPTGNLDASYAADIMAIFHAFHQVGVTIIIATHDALGMSAIQSRALHLDHGVLKQAEFTQNEHSTS
ncbi:cell division ATP-binding protein FtsE [Methylotenera sp.]|uniref:cell division ATP-binding protein FtsE n=2 Tax=Methylotenera sp. TaxID=2051956 RepID=UPI0027261F98|nr:cell division ATP-binding protein FtsE [Methylotenera sp.]MDO9206133.1 cell division ATP-binding protein FtsE [Methylotenera sp.]MDP1522973.1 cell division ATP-binding protein FtsE [Methylotenera sp.]MDP2070927.1 cell division ATP-binding protein FtsE [Methylotenera sp.]MDP2230281.1 cell division ATP-binding protein FtsE [Methylotenera sp.]MDP3005801.1 cell division ATP-binding protein FtsE [Methylotenera sp.]